MPAPLLEPHRQQEAATSSSAPTLLVVRPTAGKGLDRRHRTGRACLSAIEAIRAKRGLTASVNFLGLRHLGWHRSWPGLPPDWILVACKRAIRSKPLVLIPCRTLMELCHGLASNASAPIWVYALALISTCTGSGVEPAAGPLRGLHSAKVRCRGQRSGANAWPQPPACFPARYLRPVQATRQAALRLLAPALLGI